MDYRRCCQIAEWGLVAGVVAVHAAIFLWRENPARPNFVLMAAHDAQLLSAIVLIVGWMVLGPGRLWSRLLAGPALVGLWFLPWNVAMQPREVTGGFIGIFFCAVAAVVCGLRALGFRIASRATAGPERGAQFSLFGLLLATTAIAAAIGVLEALRPTLSAGNDLTDRLDLVLSATTATYIGGNAARETRQMVMAVAVALAGVGGAWAVLRPGAMWARLAGLAVLIPATGVYLSHVAGNADGDLMPTATSLSSGLAAVAGLVGISMLAPRMLGFRLARTSIAATDNAVQRREYPLATKVAALMLVAAAIGSMWLQGPEPEGRRQVVLAYVNDRRLIFARLRADGDLAVRPPLAAFARWVEQRNLRSFDGFFGVSFTGSVPRKVRLNQSKVGLSAVEFTVEPADGWEMRIGRQEIEQEGTEATEGNEAEPRGGAVPGWSLGPSKVEP